MPLWTPPRSTSRIAIGKSTSQQVLGSGVVNGQGFANLATITGLAVAFTPDGVRSYEVKVLMPYVVMTNASATKAFQVSLTDGAAIIGSTVKWYTLQNQVNGFELVVPFDPSTTAKTFDVRVGGTGSSAWSVGEAGTVTPFFIEAYYV